MAPTTETLSLPVITSPISVSRDDDVDWRDLV